jgi:cytochrome c oxidase assembly protein subunit 15
MSQTYNPGLHRFAIFVAAGTVVLLIAGALVTSNDAALSVPDWPLSYGTVTPPMVGGIVYEHSHRVIAATIGLLTILLAVWLWLKDGRPVVRWLGVAALAAVIAQGVLGGMTVLLNLHYGFPVEHACLAQLFFCATIALALLTSRWWQSEPPQAENSGSPSIHLLTWLTFAATFLQVILGALFRHKQASIVPHLVGAALVTGMVIWIAAVLRRRFGNIAPIVRVRILLHALLGIQMILGGAAWWSRLATADAPQPMPVMVALTAIHTLFGALTLAAALLVVLVCSRMVERGREAALAARSEGAALS